MAKQSFSTGQVLTSAQMSALQANDYNQTVSAKTASYTLAAADAGTTITMNSATATTITVNTSLFTAGDTLRIANIGAGVCTVTAGTATVTTAGTLALVQWAGGMLYFTSASAAIFFPDAVASASAPTVAQFNETQASGTNGGTATAGAFAKRTLNTTVLNNIGATLTSSVIALVAGTYNVSVIAPFYNVTGMVIRLRNTTDSTSTLQSVNNYIANSNGGYAILEGTFTITATKNFEVQYNCNTTWATGGLGLALSGGISEIYTQITIVKTA